MTADWRDRIIPFLVGVLFVAIGAGLIDGWLG